ncbi:hypothetical protein GGU45_002845 [Niabella hirudinis]
MIKIRAILDKYKVISGSDTTTANPEIPSRLNPFFRDFLLQLQQKGPSF